MLQQNVYNYRLMMLPEGPPSSPYGNIPKKTITINVVETLHEK
jgi:hypothetical protein